MGSANSTRSGLKVLWAVDPFSGSPDLRASVAQAIRALTARVKPDIEPVYVWNAYLFEAPLETPRSLLHELRVEGQRKLDETLRQVPLAGMRDLRIICQHDLTLRQETRRLIHSAKIRGADLIILGTRARKGIKRWLLGSFAESLVLDSDLPVFLVNPRWRRANRFRSILFPTDFSPESREAFRLTLNLAKTLKAKVTLFHKIRFDWSPTVESRLDMFPVYREALERAINVSWDRAEEWAEEARKAGVRAVSRVDARSMVSVSDAILSHARQASDMIALASHSGPMRAAFLGSVTRQIVRASVCPVWVIHPRRARRAAWFSISGPEVLDQLQNRPKEAA